MTGAQGTNLMVEETQVRPYHYHVVLVRSSDACVVHDGSAWGDDEAGSTPLGPVNVVGEREEGIAGADNAGQLVSMLLSLFRAERSRNLLKDGLPLSLFLR